MQPPGGVPEPTINDRVGTYNPFYQMNPA